MSEPLIVKNIITMNAPVLKVWDALTNPEQTKKYMFGCETVSDWEVGSPLLWKGVFNGVELIAVKGEIVKIEPGKFLAYTTFDPNSTMEDIPENYLTVTYELASEDRRTILTVTQGDFSKVADGQKRYHDAYNNGSGWEPVLVEIKKLVELS
jgi:uncharacterized protein YndB with AHSA1/START domain